MKKQIMYFHTFTGKKIPVTTKPLKRTFIDIYDISHGLSQLCRFSGQIKAFYSVAAHSLLVSEWVEFNGGTPKEALAALLHDASEAYLQDVPTPIKRLLPAYYRIEAHFMRAIYRKCGLKPLIPSIVWDADKAVFEQERKVLFSLVAHKMPYANRTPGAVEAAFLTRFAELGGWSLYRA